MSPAAYNIRNVRHKVDPVVDKKKVAQVEAILKNLIETGFADNCDEELLEFDEDGKLVNVIQGVTEEMRQAQQAADEVFAFKDQSSMNPSQISVTEDGVSQARFGQSQVTSSIYMGRSEAPIQIPMATQPQPAAPEEEDEPKSREEFLMLKTAYKTTKRNLKELKRSIQGAPSVEQTDQIEMGRMEKHQMKKMIKLAEGKHPDWKVQK